jgi:prolyl-tRNA synthetase
MIAELPGGGIDLLRCPECGYAARADLAAAKKLPTAPERHLPIRRISTPNCTTIEALAEFLGISTEKTAKALLYVRPTDQQLVLAVIRGDMQISERKLRLTVGDVQLASSDQITASGAVPGYASPVGLHGIHVAVDDLIPKSFNLVAGANEFGFHLENTNLGRDYEAQSIGDLTLAHAGDACANCETALVAGSGILLADDRGYHFESILHALAEAHHDEKGLCLPLGAAPFDVYLMHIPTKTEDTKGAAAEVCGQLEAEGITVLWDDREERAGVKFNDADLIGCPFRATIGARYLRNRMVEFKNRADGKVQTMKMGNLADVLQCLTEKSP